MFSSEQARDVYLSAMETGTIESCRNQTLVASPSMEPGVLTLGDAFSMAHPFTGAGMTVALNDVIFWRREIRGIPDLRDYNAVLKAQRVFIRHRKKYSFAANINSIMMYGTFTPQDGETAMNSCMDEAHHNLLEENSFIIDGKMLSMYA